MDRQVIMNCLKSVANTFPPATKIGNPTKWIVVMKKQQQPSLSNSKGGWQYFDILCYVDKGSILPLDGLLKKAKEALKPLKKKGLEFTGIETQDFYDTELGAYMNSFEIRIPKEVR